MSRRTANDSVARDIDAIILMVADAFALSHADLVGRHRAPLKCTARHAAMLIAQRALTASTPELGRAFGNRDHSTVCHGLKSAEEQMAADARHRAFIETSVAAAEYRALLRDQGGDDVLAIAMRIVRNPRREAPAATTRAVTALAMTVLDLWEVASAAEAAFVDMDPETLTVAPDDLPRVAALRAAVLNEINALAGPDPAADLRPDTEKEINHAPQA